MPGRVENMAGSESKYIDTVVELGPNERKEAVCRFTLTLYDVTPDFSKIDKIYPYDTASDMYKRYTSQSLPEIDPENQKVEEIYGIIHEKSGGNAMEYARLANEYVYRNYRYSSKTHYYSVERTVKEKAGNCENLSGLLVSILRRGGIPARTVAGVNTRGRGHTRAEFYLEKYGWFPVEGVPKDFFCMINDAKMNALFCSQKTGMYQLPGDEYGFLTTRLTGGRIGLQKHSGRGVTATPTHFFQKLQDGKPVGERTRILSY